MAQHCEHTAILQAQNLRLEAKVRSRHETRKLGLRLEVFQVEAVGLVEPRSKFPLRLHAPALAVEKELVESVQHLDKSFLCRELCVLREVRASARDAVPVRLWAKQGVKGEAADVKQVLNLVCVRRFRIRED